MVFLGLYLWFRLDIYICVRVCACVYIHIYIHICVYTQRLFLCGEDEVKIAVSDSLES